MEKILMVCLGFIAGAASIGMVAPQLHKVLPGWAILMFALIFGVIGGAAFYFILYCIDAG